MSEGLGIEQILGKAAENEKRYDWLGAVELYGKALSLVPEAGPLKLGQVQEKVGYAFYRAAMQAESQEEFKIRMRQAVADYEKAREFYGKVAEPGQAARMLRCDAVIACAGYWLASEVGEKKRLINECWRLAKECLKAFEKVGDAREYGKTFNQLSVSIDLGFFFEWEFQTRETMIEEALERGERAIRFLSTIGDSFELATAYMRTATFLEVFSFYFVDIGKREKHIQKAKDYVQKAHELSEEAFMTGLSSVLFGSGPGGFWGDGSDAAISNLEKALEHVMKTRDRFIIGCTLDQLVYHNSWRLTATEDPDQSRNIRQKALQFSEDAKRQYCLISFISPRGGARWIEASYLRHYYSLARARETNLGKRREFLEKALEVAPEALERAENSGYPDIILGQHLVFGDVLLDLAKIVTNSEEKQGLLEEALVHLNECNRISEKIQPLTYWNRGVSQSMRAIAKSELAFLAKEHETKKSMLQEATLDLEASLKLCVKEVTQGGEASITLFSLLGLGQYRHGNLLNRLYELTNDIEHLRKAIEAFENASESFKKLNLASRMAECYWKIAQVYDILGEHQKAAESFEIASSDYTKAIEGIPHLKDFYQDHALYMQAWSEIEKARHHHVRQEYGSAEEHFNKAASLHRSLKQWSYLAPNYSAWTQVEHAEELSRKEQSEEAIQAFQEATRLFEETKKSLQTELSKIEDLDEKQMATNMVKTTDLRHKYCIGRIALEEAKILDKKGDHYSSSEKYGLASEIFEKITEALESEQDRKEFKLITTLSQALAKMTQAEAEEEPNLYAGASQLFEQAKELSPNERTRMLVSGHSRFCRALEAGTKFADTKDQALYATFMQHLESASNYYVKAGFRNASEYAKATKLLFDAYVNMDNAQRETDPEKKAKLYTMADRILQTSAGSFMKAEHPEKREQVLRLLDKVKEERELALSLSEVMHAPTIVSTTTAFSTPTPTQENAVGLERFEHADIQANIITRQKALKIGESLDLEIELVNAGKGPALLTKITEVIPEGFELIQKPENYRVEDSYLNMKGKRLDPLKTEEVRLVLKPKVQGTFPLKPRILYLDENGKYKSHEPEPITITVKELGIKGWIKGER